MTRNCGTVACSPSGSARVSTVTAYRQWSASYDAEMGGGLFAMDEPVMEPWFRRGPLHIGRPQMRGCGPVR